MVPESSCDEIEWMSPVLQCWDSTRKTLWNQSFSNWLPFLVTVLGESEMKKNFKTNNYEQNFQNVLGEHACI